DHRLAGLAAPGLLKLRHVLEYAVGSESTRRMRIYVHQHPRVLRLPLLAPNPCKAQEITLFGRVSINFIGLLTGLLDLVLECHQRNSGAAIVGCVLPERQLSIQLQVIDGYEIAVLVRNTAGTLFKFLSVLLGPPIAQIALCIELAPLIVKAMRQLMSNHGSDRTEIHVFIHALVEEGWLQNAGWKDNLVHRSAVIGIHRGGCHLPFFFVDGLADLCNLPPRFELVGAQEIAHQVAL